MWNISLDSAYRTFESTTQRHLRLNKSSSVYRSYKILAHQLQYLQMGGFLGKFSSDIFHSKITSTHGNNYTTVFANRRNFTHSVYIPAKSDANFALDWFLSIIDFPLEALTDSTFELHKTAWANLCKRYYISQLLTKPDSLWKNPIKFQGGIIKRRVRNRMWSTHTHMRLWDYS